MMDYVSKSYHDLLAGESEVMSDSASSRGSHHPSRECFKAGVPEGHVEDAHSRETPSNGPKDKARKRYQAPPPAWLEQLWDRHKELKEALLQIEQECAKLEREIGCCGDVVRAGRRPSRKPEDPQRRRGSPAFCPGKLEHRHHHSFAGKAPRASAARGLLRSPKVAHAQRARGTTRGRELEVSVTRAKYEPPPLCGAGYQGHVRPLSLMRGRRSRERLRSGTPRRRSRHTPHHQHPEAWARGQESGGKPRITPSPWSTP
jgi:hypothetical protein